MTSDEKDARKRRLDRIKRLLSVATLVLDAEPIVHALPCRDDAIKNVLQAKLFEASQNLLALIDELTSELRAATPEGQK